MTKALRRPLPVGVDLKMYFTKKARRKVREHLKNITIIVVDCTKRRDKYFILIWTLKISLIIKINMHIIILIQGKDIITHDAEIANTLNKCFDNTVKTGRDGTGRDGTGRDGTGRDGTGRDGTGRDGTGRDGTGRDGTGRDGTGRDGTGRDGTGRFISSWCMYNS